MGMQIGDIVRFEDMDGLFEVTDKKTDGSFTVTNDSCITEYRFLQSKAILVCESRKRKDI